MTCYAACPDITKTVTPDLKFPDLGHIIHVNLGGGKYRLGGSALSTVYGQLGNESADLDDVAQFKRCFKCIQSLINDRLLESGIVINIYIVVVII